MDATRLGESLWTIHLEHMRTLEQILAASHTRGEYGLLMYLYHVGRPMFPGELTEKLGLTTGRIANILRVLERSGLVMRTPDATDRRRVLVAITPQGEELAARLTHEAIAYHTQLMSQLDEAEAHRFLEMLERLVTAADANGSTIVP